MGVKQTNCYTALNVIIFFGYYLRVPPTSPYKFSFAKRATATSLHRFVYTCARTPSCPLKEVSLTAVSLEPSLGVLIDVIRIPV